MPGIILLDPYTSEPVFGTDLYAGVIGALHSCGMLIQHLVLFC
jgi:hypothetical protein